MKLKRIYKITEQEADRLIELYYDGLTTVDEEKILEDFLSKVKLPSKYEPEIAIFGYFDKKKQKPSFGLTSNVLWKSIAAVAIISFFSIQYWSNENTKSYAFINGVKTTDMNLIKTQAIASITSLNSSGDIVAKTIQQLNDKDIVQQQLDVFAAFE